MTKSPASTSSRLRLPALGCAAALLLCLPLVKPWVEMGVNDEPSYVRSAQILAQTGRIVYNGWAAPILGWHLYWGALFIKLFGFSFNVTRLSTLPVAMAAAFLSQRSMVRSGLTEWNATLATLTLVLSPLFLPLTFSYMTDIGGYFVLVLCFYACLRTLEADTEAEACWWIAFAAISNGIAGTIRQTGWLGLLVIVPSTLWVVRRRKRVLVRGIVSMAAGLAIMLGAMEWHRHQPGIMPEPLWRGPLTKDRVRETVQYMARFFFDAPLFLLPVLLPFLPKVNWKDRRSQLTFLASCITICAVLVGVERQLVVWLEPSIGNYVTQQGVMGATDINGDRPVILTLGIRIALSALVIAAVGAIVTVLRNTTALHDRARADVLPWSSLFWLAAPVSAVYAALLTSRAGVNMVFDRYLFPLLLVALIVIARVYQERISLQLPRYSAVLLAVFAIYSVGATHDAFALQRARLKAIRQLEMRGVPDSEIDGGWDFNAWTELNRTGFLKPQEGQVGAPTAVAEPEFACAPYFPESIGGLHSRYTLSYNPNGCGGRVGLPPVHYREWFGPSDVSIYIVSSLRQPMKPDAFRD